METDCPPTLTEKEAAVPRPPTIASPPANRQAELLKAAIEVSRTISSILDPEFLLARTVDIICDRYGFYYAGIFLIETQPDGTWAVLKAGRGEAGRQMLANGHRLEVGGRSMVGTCTALNAARIAPDVRRERLWYDNPLLPDTRAELTLPLAIADEVIGALTVQSTQRHAFTPDDVASLQAMADQLAVAINNARLHHLNAELFRKASRRATMLQAGAEVSRNISSILDLDVLLASTVHIICEEFRFNFAGIFLVREQEDGQLCAVLRAARGEAGRHWVEQGFSLPVTNDTLVGAAIVSQEAKIAGQIDSIQAWYPTDLLPQTRSEMTLPLIATDQAIGALTVQSDQPAAFSKEDVAALQAMADQLAVAINNARLLRDLEQANRELVRTKMFETIATATGETIHWVGNKAAPIPACVDRLRDDLSRFLVVAADLIARADDSLQADPLAQHLLAAARYLHEKRPGLAADLAQFKQLSFNRQRRLLDSESIDEDLDLIAQSANTILRIKEDLIGPARRQNLQEVDLVALVRANLRQAGLPDHLVTLQLKTAIPYVKIDPVQFDHVLDNLVKNALEAMETQPQPRLQISMWKANAYFVRVAITDNGCGISEADMTKIWLKFHTSKANKGGTGLGLPACLQIMEAMGGRISVISEAGVGSTFTLHVPIYRADQA